jgi:hypothetical protein
MYIVVTLYHVEENKETLYSVRVQYRIFSLQIFSI